MSNLGSDYEHYSQIARDLGLPEEAAHDLISAAFEGIEVGRDEQGLLFIHDKYGSGSAEGLSEEDFQQRLKQALEQYE